MAKTYKYNINKDGIGKVSFIDEEAPYSDDPTPGHPDWNLTKKGGKKKKSKKA